MLILPQWAIVFRTRQETNPFHSLCKTGSSEKASHYISKSFQPETKQKNALIEISSNTRIGCWNLFISSFQPLSPTHAQNQTGARNFWFRFLNRPEPLRFLTAGQTQALGTRLVIHARPFRYPRSQYLKNRPGDSKFLMQKRKKSKRNSTSEKLSLLDSVDLICAYYNSGLWTSEQACVSQKTRKLLGPENGPEKPPKQLSSVSQSAREVRARENHVIFPRKLYGSSWAPENLSRDLFYPHKMTFSEELFWKKRRRRPYLKRTKVEVVREKDCWQDSVTNLKTNSGAPRRTLTPRRERSASDLRSYSIVDFFRLKLFKEIAKIHSAYVQQVRQITERQW